MNKLLNIRQFYRPLQPVMRPAESGVTYQEFPPAPGLRAYIYCYWHLKTNKPLEAAFSYRVVADGCIDIFFETSVPEENFVMGFCKEHTEFPLGNSFNYTGVRFLPGMFPLIFHMNAGELTGRFERLDVVTPEIARFIAQSFHPRLTDAEVNDLFDEYFLSRLSKISLVSDPRIVNAIAAILENNGALQVEKDLDTGISPRQLRRLFNYYIGEAPKTFSQVIRFQYILRTQFHHGSPQRPDFNEAGYYDQPHFIKEFRNFYGLTPGHLFRDKRP